jgi:hypothetical protein
MLLALPALAQTSDIPFQDSFESYDSIIVDTNGVGTNGWSGIPGGTTPIAWVVATNYASPAGFPLEGEHSKVMEFQGVVSNNFDTSRYFTGEEVDTNNLIHKVYLDCMLQPMQVNFEPTMDPDVQTAAFFNTNGHLVIWHSYYTNGFQDQVVQWTELSHNPVASDEWVRVTITMDYLSAMTNPAGVAQGADWSENEHYFQVQINGGEPLTHPLGYLSPTPADETEMGGSHFLCADSGFLAQSENPNNRYFSGLSLEGIGRMDDAVVTDQPVEFAEGFYITVIAGPGGRINPAGPQVRVAAGSNQTFNIVADANFTIDDVLIDDVSIGATNMYTFVAVLTNHTIEALFASSLSPLEEWLDGYGLLDDPNGDEDGDGATNSEEYYAGTNPTLPGSAFRVIRQVHAPDSNEITWVVDTNSTVTTGFIIYRSTNLLNNGAWTPIDTVDRNLGGTNNVWIDVDPPSNGPAFYQPRIPIE